MALDAKSILDDDDYRIMLLALMTYVQAAKGAPLGSALMRSSVHAQIALMKLQGTTEGFSINTFTGDDYNAIVRALSSFSDGLSVSSLRTKGHEESSLIDDYILKTSKTLRKLRIIAEAQTDFTDNPQKDKYTK